MNIKIFKKIIIVNNNINLFININIINKNKMLYNLIFLNLKKKNKLNK